LNVVPVRNWTVLRSRPGDTLSFPKKIWGNRAYLSVQGGFKVHRWLGSSSTNSKAKIGGFNGRKLRTGDRLEFDDPACEGSHRMGLSIGLSLTQAYFNSAKIMVTPGPEFEMLTAVSHEKLFSTSFRILPNSDRMGFRIGGDDLFRMDDDELLSSGVTFGTIQLLPDGQMIILMADHQTTGGYPRILSVASRDLSRLAQMGPGDEIRFELIDIAEAEQQHLEFQKGLAFLRTGLTARTSGVL
jgi:antagonist of KipI